MNEILDFDYTALAALISRRWQEDRPYFTPNRKGRGAWLEGSWRQPENSGLKLHWSRRSPAVQVQPAFARMALQTSSRGDPI